MTVIVASCSDDDTFSTDSSLRLTFSADTVKMDTVFSRVPAPTRTFWVYNHSGKGIRLSSVRLERGNQAGFRVNVDGVYLSQTQGYQALDVEVRKGDSIRVFVEITSVDALQKDPKKIEDNLLFTHESGVVQKVNLMAYTWDAIRLDNHTVTTDETLTAGTPYIIYGDLTVAEGATLTLEAGTRLFFHDSAHLMVNGTLKSLGTAEQNVEMRGDRLDHMFDYLPYDRVPGQWGGVVFKETSKENVLLYTDIHSARNGIDAKAERPEEPQVTLNACTIHNCDTHCLMLFDTNVVMENTQVSNAAGDCVHADCSRVEMNQCTVAQFYIIAGGYGNAINYTNIRNNEAVDYAYLLCINSIVTGYADDEIIISIPETEKSDNASFLFCNTLLRTPEVADYSECFPGCIFEDKDDKETAGDKNFVRVSIDLLDYDYHLSEVSKARGKADPATSLSHDRDGKQRSLEAPSMGCFE